MGRRRRGWVRDRGGVLYVGFTLQSGRAWERAARDEDGAPLTEREAEQLRDVLLADYLAGRWDPEAPVAEASTETEVTVEAYVRAWGKARVYESAAEDRATIERYIVRAPIGALRVKELRPRHARAFVQWLVARASERGGRLAPRTVRNTFDVLRRALRDAVVDELLSANPCEPVRGELPSIVDKDPAARAGWDFTRAEIEALLFDPRLHLDRRVVHALRLLTGARIGEVVALRWSDWDRTAAPLTRLTIARAIKSISRAEGSTKTGAIKVVPVHPVLAGILERWRGEGWETTFGRPPTPEDLIAPTARGPRRGEVRTTHAENNAFRDDQAVIGFAHVRHQHVARHAFVSRTLADGGDGSVLRWITHAPPRTAHDGYTRADWGRLCTELAKLKLSAPGGDSLANTLAVPPKTSPNAVETHGATQESNLPASVPSVAFRSDIAEPSESEGDRSAPIRSDSLAVPGYLERPVTPRPDAVLDHLAACETLRLLEAGENLQWLLEPPLGGVVQ